MNACIGCDTKLAAKSEEVSKETPSPAAYAIMHMRDFLAMEVAPVILGSGSFHSGPVCASCFADPSKRKRQLKAHFQTADDMRRVHAATHMAGSSGNIGG
jgi:hypothetical protein